MDWTLRSVSSIFDVTAARNASLSFSTPSYSLTLLSSNCGLSFENPWYLRHLLSLSETKLSLRKALTPVALRWCLFLSLLVFVGWMSRDIGHRSGSAELLPHWNCFTLFNENCLLPSISVSFGCYLFNLSLSITFFRGCWHLIFFPSTILHFFFLLKAALTFCFVFLIRGQYHHTSR